MAHGYTNGVACGYTNGVARGCTEGVAHGTGWHMGALTRWHMDVLMGRHMDVLMGQHVDVPTGWHMDALTGWHVDTLMGWHVDVPTGWHRQGRPHLLEAFHTLLAWLHSPGRDGAVPSRRARGAMAVGSRPARSAEQTASKQAFEGGIVLQKRADRVTPSRVHHGWQHPSTLLLPAAHGTASLHLHWIYQSAGSSRLPGAAGDRAWSWHGWWPWGWHGRWPWGWHSRRPRLGRRTPCSAARYALHLHVQLPWCGVRSGFACTSDHSCIQIPSVVAITTSTHVIKVITHTNWACDCMGISRVGFFYFLIKVRSLKTKIDSKLCFKLSAHLAIPAYNDCL